LELELRNQAGIEKWKKVLAEEWGITKRTQLLEKIAWIETKGDSELFLELAQVLKEKNNKSLNQIGVELGYNDFQIKRLYLVNGKQKIVGERALRAWDYSRMALLCRIGYQVGFLSDNEAWTQLERILTQVESQYLSWEDYAANYTLGLFFWGLEFEMEFEKVNQTLQAYAKLTCSSGYVWELAWNRNAQNSQVYINTFEDVLFFPPVQYRAWKSYLNGWQCFESGEFGSALEYYQKGLALDPGFSELWLLIAMVYNAQMDYGKAIEILNDYLKEKPDEYLPRIYLAEIYEKINHIEEAIAEYNQAIDLDDTKPEGFVGLGRIGINSGDYDLAISYLRIAESLYLNEDENIYYTLYLLGYSYYKTEKFDKALSFLLRASPKFQDDDMYLNYYLGVCYLYEQNINLASTYLARAEELGLTIPKEVKGLLTETNGP
jgi:tetratricopeptide (TPR) repeat protein